MERSRIKTIIITVLLVLNLFLAGNLIIRGISDRKLRESETADLLDILVKSGVTLEKAAIPSEVVRSTLLETRRDEKKEEQAAKALLGECSKEELGGGMVKYLSAYGSTTFRRGFELEMTFRIKGIGGMSSDAAKKALSEALKNAGFGLYGELGETGTKGGLSFEISQYVGKLPVQNVGLKATVITDDTVLLTGKWVFAYGVKPDEMDRSMSASSLVLPFVAAMKGEGTEIKRIQSGEYGFYLEQSAAGGFELIPSLAFDTDKGRYTVGALRFSVLERPSENASESDGKSS